MKGVNGFEIRAKCFLLEWMLIDMKVVRNLTSRWYYDQPLASISVHIPAVTVRSLVPLPPHTTCGS